MQPNNAVLNNLQRFFNLPRWQKRLIIGLVDIALVPLALWCSFALRLSDWTPNLDHQTLHLFVLMPLVSLPIFIHLGLYQSIIRFIGGQAITNLFKGATLSTFALIVLALFFLAPQTIPRTVFFIYGGILFLLMGGSRYCIRQLHDFIQRQTHRHNVAIYGAGAAGIQLVQALKSSQEYHPVLFVDDNHSLHQAIVNGLRVYPPNHLASLVKKHRIEQLLLAMPSANQQRRNEILRRLEPLPIHIKTIPGLTDLVSGADVAELREIDLNDLLGRQQIAPDTKLLESCITQKNVLVTGAGGSIGAELCRQIIQHRPEKLVLFEISEFALYTIDQELRNQCQQRDIELIAAIGSVCDQSRIGNLLTQHQIHTLYHAAAYKHVPLVEHNPFEGLQNNVLGTYSAACAAQQAGIKHFVLISSDKAVRPTNVMGASKRLAELALQALTPQSSHTIFSMVRFGNVLGSSGSVVPLFRDQIRAGGPLTVTHPNITRYFMSISEAAQLVIQAGAMAQGGEVFVLDMGEPVKIHDLAQRMINLSGLREKSATKPEGEIEIIFTGLRPGEKLYEELLIDADAVPTKHPRIFHAHEKGLTLREYQQMLDRLNTVSQRMNTAALYHLLETYVSGYQAPISKQTNKVIPLIPYPSNQRLIQKV